MPDAAADATNLLYESAWQLLNADISVYSDNSFRSFSMPDTAADATNLLRRISSNFLAVAECRYKYLLCESF